jgi:hypothetical protein
MKSAATVCLMIAILMALMMLPAVVQGPRPGESQWFAHILAVLFLTVIFLGSGLLLLRAAQKREEGIVRAVPERPSKNPFA